MAYVETYPAVDRRELLRWSACAAAVLLVHGLVLLALWHFEGGLRPCVAEMGT